MKAIYVDDEVHRQLRLRAAARQVPLRRLAEDFVKAGLRGSGARTPRGATDVSTDELTAAAVGGGSFDLLARREEDIYLPTDGQAIE